MKNQLPVTLYQMKETMARGGLPQDLDDQLIDNAV